MTSTAAPRLDDVPPGMQRITVVTGGDRSRRVEGFVGRWLVTPIDRGRGYAEGTGVAFTKGGKLAVFTQREADGNDPSLTVFDSIDAVAEAEVIPSGVVMHVRELLAEQYGPVTWHDV